VNKTFAGFKTVLLLEPSWDNAQKEKAGFVFDIVKPTSKEEQSKPDLPSNMISNSTSPNLPSLTPKQLETIFWQARGHDGCYKSVTLFQHFFDLYAPGTSIRVRTAEGDEYTTTISTRVILEMKLYGLKLLTASLVLPVNQTYITGAQDGMDHAVIGFAESAEGNVKTIIDLASMQFGDVGRGLGGRSTFAVESLDKFYDRLERIATGVDEQKTSARIGPCPEDARLKRVARKVKERLRHKESEPWCGHCGAPIQIVKKCSACKEAFYCDDAHQKAAWPFHKKFCSK